MLSDKGRIWVGATSGADGVGAGAKQVFAEKLGNVPGKGLTGVVVSYAPGGKSNKHHHAGSVFAYVLSGAIRSQNSGTGPVKVYKTGESFFSRLEVNISSARTRARKSRRACSRSSLPTTAHS